MLAGKQFHGQKSLLGHTRWDGRVGHGWVTNTFIFNSYDGIIYAIVSKYNIISIYWVRSMLLLLSRFSHVRLCATPLTSAHQAPPSPGFSRQEHWSGLPLPSPTHESEKWKWSRSVVSDSSDPMDCSLPGSSVHGIFQAKVLEWGAIAFSNI